MFDYDQEELLPEYADERYEGCQTATEAKILRMVLVYLDLASRYEVPKFKYTNFKGERCLRTHRPTMSLGNYVVPKLGDRDPGYFISYVFERWQVENIHLMDEKKIPKHGGLCGIAYPSWSQICAYREELLANFLAVPNYEPTRYASKESLSDRWKQVIQGKVVRWLGIHPDKTERDYWLGNPEHVFPPHLEARMVKYCVWLQEHAKEFESAFGFSLKELEEGLKELEKEWCAKVKLTTIPDEEWMDPLSLARADYVERAMQRGEDVMAEGFEQKMEEDLNPVDMYHPDTVMFFMYGDGEPRREYD